MYLRSLFIICLEIRGIHDTLLVRPEDVVGEKVGANVSFRCATKSTDQTDRWIYTAERSFRRPIHIYANGRIFPRWREKLIVIESTKELFTLTINSVECTDDGFYTCMDLSNDSKATAQLKMSISTEATTEKSPAEEKTRKILPIMFAPLLFALPSETEPQSDQGQTIIIQINQSVNLSSHANKEEIVKWLLHPELGDPNDYFTLYDSSGEKPRKDGCGGYHFTKDHSIFIANAQPCHAGTYTAEKPFSGSSKTTILIVNDAEDVTASKDTNDAFGTESDLSQTPTTNKDSDHVTKIVVGVVTLVIAVIILAVVALKLVLLQKRKSENTRTRTNAVSYKPVDPRETATIHLTAD